MRPLRLVAIIATAMLACGGDSPGNPLDAGAAVGLAGSWQLESGVLFPAGDEIDAIDYIELVATTDSGRAGTGTVFGSSASGLLGCGPVLFAELESGSVAFEVPDLGVVLDVRALERPDDDVLLLTDSAGQTVELHRVEAIPDEARCVEASPIASVPLPIEADRSGLVPDGTALWYEAADGTWIPYNPADDTFGAAEAIPFTVGQFTHIHALQDADFWAHCGCGQNRSLRRLARDTGNTVDEVDTNTFSEPVNVRGIAFDGDSLLVTGNDPFSFESKILVVATSPGVPAELLSAKELGFRTQGLGLRGGQVWTITQALGSTLVRFDPVTGNVLDSAKLPRDLTATGAIAWIDDTAYVLGRFEPDGEESIIKLNVP